jgi:flagellar protein FliO/FliZ
MTKLTPRSRAVAQVAAVLGASLLVFACPAEAFTESNTKAPGGENTPLNLNGSSPTTHSSTAGGASIVRTIVGLAIVIAVIWGLYWILRQVKSSKDPQAPSGGLANVSALPLGSGRTLHLVRAGSDYLLLAGGDHGLVPIQRYTEQQALEAGLLLHETSGRTRPVALARQLVAAQLTPRDEIPGSFTPERVTSGKVAVGHRPDPMRMPSTSTGLIERLREWTVRR